MAFFFVHWGLLSVIISSIHQHLVGFGGGGGVVFLLRSSTFFSSPRIFPNRTIVVLPCNLSRLLLLVPSDHVAHVCAPQQCLPEPTPHFVIMGKSVPLPLLPVILASLVQVAAASHGASSYQDYLVDKVLPPNLHVKSLIFVKACCLIIVFWSTFFAAISPYFLRWNSSFLVLGTQYSGGVFLSTALIHFLSDSHNGFQNLTTNDYAFAELLASLGYLITMFGDLVIQWVSLRDPNSHAPASVDEVKGVITLGVSCNGDVEDELART